ncbi:MAG: hypothetical protein K0Q94_2946 [Paenibacillus sp.]|jgi:hypothetical protein|uniref:DUF2953 domain-containing protein n=1 Tax=Paenibacillus sp. GCM10012303 TaxID=3317340 RepID=UPI0029E9401C|nr:hypothetical protein [Paenibacillus sp.]
MLWIWLVAGILVAGMLLFVFSDIHIRVRYSRVENDDTLAVDIRGMFGLLRLHYKVPLIEWEGRGFRLRLEQMNRKLNELLDEHKTVITREKIEQFFHKTKMLLAHTAELVEWTKSVLSRTVCTELSWVTRIGLGDAADTAVTTGVVWGIKTSILGYLLRFVRLEARPSLNVQPQFNRTMFSTEAVCKFKLKALYAVYAAFRLLVRILRAKGGLRTWRKIWFKPS